MLPTNRDDNIHDAYDADTRDEAEMDYLLLQRELKVWEAARDLATKIYGSQPSWADSEWISTVVAALDDKVQEVKRGKTQV